MPPDLTTATGIYEYCASLAKAGTEHAHQRAFFAWLQVMKNNGTHPLAHMTFAIPNGGYRDKITAGKLRAEGVKPGVADICYPVAIGPHHSLWIEMKKPVVGRLAEHQSEWAIYMRTCGHAVVTCYSWGGAAQAFTDYANQTLGREIFQ